MLHPPEPPSKSSRSLDDPYSCNDVLNVSPQLNSVSMSSFPPRSVSLQSHQSLLILIHLNLLKRLLKSSFNMNYGNPRRPLLGLRKQLPIFFNQVGYVSDRFFETAVLASKVLFHTTTFHIVSESLPQLVSFASLFGAEVTSVFLHVDGTFKAEEFLSHSNVISGLKLKLEHNIDLNFLCKSSKIFPRLKQFQVCSLPSVSLALIGLLKVNDTVTRVDMWNNSIGVEGARKLADALKVNTTVTSIDLGKTLLKMKVLELWQRH
ncbi:hypothetical protein GEMRC1_009650 [Eukaryota sp. GEM-RC1]